MASLRVHLTQSNTSNHGWSTSSPAPAYEDHTIQRSKNSIPVRLIRRLTYRSPQQLDPNSIPVFTKRELRRRARKEQKEEQKQLDDLVAYQRKKFQDEVSQQWEANQPTRGDGVKQSRSTRVKNKVKNTIRRTKRVPEQTNNGHINPSLITNHINQSKIEEASTKDVPSTYYQPSDVEASRHLVNGSFVAELPAESSPYLSTERNLITRAFDDNVEISPLSPPPPIRSPSPCLSALPRRGATVSETLAGPSSRQMQCDYCHGAIRLTGYHYACNVCHDGDCLYCFKCANEGNTCRHELVERTRNIKRHPTNPSSGERSRLLVEDTLSENGAYSAELSGASILPKPSQAIEVRAEPISTAVQCQPSSISPINTDELFRDFEAKRREQEVVFREKEVVLREREAMLREREAWTMSKERDVAMVQQLHAAAMLQQRSEAGLQHAVSSRRNPHLGSVSRHSSAASYMKQIPSLSRRSDGIVLHSDEIAKRPNIELGTSVAAMEASFEEMDMNEKGIRSHANSSKRKAPTSPNRKSTASRSTPKANLTSGRGSSSRHNDEEGDENDEDDEDDSDGSSPKRHKSNSSNHEPQKTFACPYTKHDPARYTGSNTAEIHYRSCDGGLYRDISRVKQHLKRVHHRPDFYCRRCFREFDKSEKLQKHYSSPKPCDVRDCPWPERLDETKQSKIHIKRPRMDPKELWYEIFNIIFPGKPRPDSPYIEQPQTHPVILLQFVEMFNHRLNLASDSKPWLKSAAARSFLNEQMTHVLQDLRVHSNAPSIGAPSVLVSPISSSMDFRGGSSQRSSRESSALPSHTPVSPPTTSTIRRVLSQSRNPVRPALTLDSNHAGVSRHFHQSNSATSANSHHGSLFPPVSQHIYEDSGWVQGESWNSGDDTHVMGETQMPEPSSATSIRSTKSVSFRTPDQDEEEEEHMFTNNDTGVPTLMDMATYWASNQRYAHTLDPQSADQAYHRQVLAEFDQKQQRPVQQRADSAYGTLGSRHPSSSSLANSHSETSSYHSTSVKRGKRRQLDEFDYTQSQWGGMPDNPIFENVCIDPQVLHYYSPEGARQADTQAYLGRHSGSQ